MIAFSLGTSVLIKMGRARYAWVTAVPLVFLFAVTFSAGLINIFSPDPALGFLAGARSFAGKIAAGGSPEQIALWERPFEMNQVDAFVAGLFLVFIAVMWLMRLRLVSAAHAAKTGRAARVPVRAARGGGAGIGARDSGLGACRERTGRSGVSPAALLLLASCFCLPY